MAISDVILWKYTCLAEQASVVDADVRFPVIFTPESQLGGTFQLAILDSMAISGT